MRAELWGRNIFKMTNFNFLWWDHNIKEEGVGLIGDKFSSTLYNDWESVSYPFQRFAL